MSSSAITPSVTGAWLLHHDQKLNAVQSQDFQNITLAGRAARLLSVMSRENEWTVDTRRVQELARVNDIRKHEIAGLLEELKKLGLVDQTAAGVAVLGITQSTLLSHAAGIFDAQSPDGLEVAAIALAERASRAPTTRADCAEELADQHRLSRAEVDDLFNLSARIGFVDYEEGGSHRLYFNGSLFRRDQAIKAKAILEGLDARERAAVQEADGGLDERGCLQADAMQQVLGAVLWSKLHQIGYYDVSTVTNERGQNPFVMKPSALVKYVPGGLADMLDDAKALASSLMYGIVKSHHTRGKIRDPSLLLGALTNRGYVEGPVAAIKQDYQFLERRGVVQVTPTSNGNRLSLLKPEIGKMAGELILRGNAAEAAVQAVVGLQGVLFEGPERVRSAERKKSVPEARSGASRALDILRKST